MSESDVIVISIPLARLLKSHGAAHLMALCIQKADASKDQGHEGWFTARDEDWANEMMQPLGATRRYLKRCLPYLERKREYFPTRTSYRLNEDRLVSALKERGLA